MEVSGWRVDGWEGVDGITGVDGGVVEEREVWMERSWVEGVWVERGVDGVGRMELLVWCGWRVDGGWVDGWMEGLCRGCLLGMDGGRGWMERGWMEGDGGWWQLVDGASRQDGGRLAGWSGWRGGWSLGLLDGWSYGGKWLDGGRLDGGMVCADVAYRVLGWRAVGWTWQGLDGWRGWRGGGLDGGGGWRVGLGWMEGCGLDAGEVEEWGLVEAGSWMPGGWMVGGVEGWMEGRQ